MDKNIRDLKSPYLKFNIFTMKLNYTLIFRQEKNWYSVSVLELPWCVSEWETREEALKNIKEAIWLYLEWMMEIAKMKEKQEKEISLSSLTFDYEAV